MKGTRPGTPARVTLVLGTVAGGTGAHVKMLVTGLTERGVGVTVAGPSSADARFSFSSVPSVPFCAVEISDRPRAGDVAGILRLRRLLLRGVTGETHRGGSFGGDLVAHAHGLRAGALTVLALTLVRRERPGVVVTVHNAPPGGRATGLVYRLLEHVVARGADLVLCVSPDLERRMRAAAARQVERAVIAAPDASRGPSAGRAASAGPSLAAAVQEDRPVVLAAGRLARQKGFGVFLEAAAAWQDLDPSPLVTIAGDGPLAGELRERAAELGVDTLFVGHRDDVTALLGVAAVFVLPSGWEGQPLVLQEALRAGTPVVATRVGGVPGLTGEEAALLVPAGDARALGEAVRSVLTDTALATRLRAAAAARAATLPTEADAVSAAVNAYASVRRGTALR
jgi:glycosyltransferase involved in cell wall biosynthesis